MKIDVLYQFNEKYAPYAGVSITSLFENNRHIDEIKVYILADKISPISIARLKKTAEKYGRELEFLDTQNLIELMKELNIPTYRGSYAANLKMFIPMVLGKNIDRLLYIDSDTIVNGDVEPLFDLDMQDKPLGMSLDSLGVKHKELIGLQTKDDYYNTGVMLFDLSKWKECMCTEKVIEHVRNVRAHYMSPDQDIVNVALKNYIFRLDMTYNLQPIHIVYDYKQFKKSFWQQGYYNEQEIKNAVENPVIVHFFRFLGQFPWDKDSVHPDTELFSQYMDISLWSDYERCTAAQQSFVFRVERWLYKNMPKMVFLTLFRINYNMFIRRAERDSRKNKNNKEM